MPKNMNGCPINLEDYAQQVKLNYLNVKLSILKGSDLRVVLKDNNTWFTSTFEEGQKGLGEIIRPQTLEQIFKISKVINEADKKRGKYTHGQKIGTEEQYLVINEQGKIELTVKNENSSKSPYTYKFQLSRIKIYDSQSKYYSNFSIDGNFVTKNDEDDWTQILLSPKINPNKQFSFKFKITQTQYNAIFIGIVDKQRIKERNSSNTLKAIAYSGLGVIYPHGKKQGQGFQKDDIVETIVKLKQKSVEWKVNDISVAKISQKYLSDTKIQYVPFVQLSHSGDTLQWLGYLEK